MTQHGVGYLADHHGLERTGHGNKEEHGYYTKRDQDGGKKGPSFITPQVTGGKFEYVQHGCLLNYLPVV
jgi:hypothetical protein